MPNLENDDQGHDGGSNVADEFSFYLNKTIYGYTPTSKQALNKACLSNV